MERPPTPSRQDTPSKWNLFVDGSSSSGGCGAGLVLISPDGYKTSYVLRFAFNASNNEAEYEALIAGLGLARELGVDAIEVYSDFNVGRESGRWNIPSKAREDGQIPSEGQEPARPVQAV